MLFIKSGNLHVLKGLQA